MKILKIKAYQVFANYRKPMSFNFWDTYPLPPLSTVRGWFHTVIGADRYIPISMSIQGDFSGIVYDLQTIIKFDRIRKEKSQTILEGFKKAFSRSPTYVANVYDIKLTIYIASELESLKKFRENLLKNEYPYFGRREDLLRIDFVDFIEPEKKNFSKDGHVIDYGIYLNESTAKSLNLTGINYRMNFKYDKDLLDKTGIRYFEKKNVVYIDDEVIENGEFLYDRDDDRIIDFVGDYF